MSWNRTPARAVGLLPCETGTWVLVLPPPPQHRSRLLQAAVSGMRIAIHSLPDDIKRSPTINLSLVDGLGRLEQFRVLRGGNEPQGDHIVS